MAQALESIFAREGRLDVVVCSAYTTPPGTDTGGLRADFWTHGGMAMWDAVNGVGLRGVYATCAAAAPLMISTAKAEAEAGQRRESPPPLMVLVSSFGGKSYTFNVAYGVGKAAIDRLALDMSLQLKEHGSRPASIRSLKYLAPNFIFKEIEREGTAVPRWVRENVPDLLLPWSVFAGGPPPGDRASNEK